MKIKRELLVYFFTVCVVVSLEISVLASSGAVKIAIIEIESVHAVQVQSIVEDIIRQENASDNIEIIPIILPGVWDGNGLKIVAKSSILAAFSEAKKQGAKIINLSIGYNGKLEQSLLDALKDLCDSGILLVAAAGNNYGAQDIWNQAGDSVISVGALDQYGRRAYISNYGDIYAKVTGKFPCTSFAAPQVSARAALLLAQNPALTTADLRNMLCSNSDTIFNQIPQEDLSVDFMIPSFRTEPVFIRPELFFLEPRYQTAPYFF